MKKSTGNRGGRYQQKAQPEGKVRKSQVITTYGPGAMVDLIEDAVLVGGLDFWKFDPKAGPTIIAEPRLRDELARRLEANGRKLRRDEAFREPPAGDDQSPDPRTGIHALEFPRWFVCQNPDCRALCRGQDGFGLEDEHYVHECGRGKKSPTVPVRFVMTCRRGHIDDFPWRYFVHEHQGKPACPNAELRLLEGPTGDFTQIRVVCEVCKASRPVSDANIREKNPRCGGHRPWLGAEAREDCREPQRLLVRTASNSYFSQVVSSLDIPDPLGEVRNKVESVWSILQVADEPTLDIFLLIPAVKAAVGSFERKDVLSAIRALQHGEAMARSGGLRTAEFLQFVRQKPEAAGELPPADAAFFARSAEPRGGLPRGIERLVLAHKLREVRAQLGFTRIDAAASDLQGMPSEHELGVRIAPLGLQADWLPAIEVRGEGIFLKLDEPLVQRWETKDAVVKRAEQLAAAYDRWATKNDVKLPFPGVRFYLLHSLAHLLVAAISLDCGYAASAIRERIYCAPETDETPMAAILLATGTPGTEGTLGGLVGEGRNLGTHMRRARELCILCSNDPVCAGHDPAEDPTERWLEGAACHGCLFIAECSCERFNRYLDRALVFPTIGHEGAAFFEDVP